MSEKPMTELLRSSGIINKHIVEFEKWRLISEVGHEVRKPAEEMIEDLVEDITKVLEEEPIMKQTIVTPIRVSAPKLWYGEHENFHVNMDEMGRLVVPPSVDLVAGETIWCEDKPDSNYTVMQEEELYENDTVVAKLVTIEPVKE